MSLATALSLELNVPGDCVWDSIVSKSLTCPPPICFLNGEEASDGPREIPLLFLSHYPGLQLSVSETTYNICSLALCLSFKNKSHIVCILLEPRLGQG